MAYNFLYSFRAESKLKPHESVCRNYDHFHIKAPNTFNKMLKFTLQIPNSVGDKFSHWDSQNETLTTHFEQKTETTLSVSYFEKIMSHWDYI